MVNKRSRKGEVTLKHLVIIFRVNINFYTVISISSELGRREEDRRERMNGD